jgi:predicted membrane protein
MDVTAAVLFLAGSLLIMASIIIIAAAIIAINNLIYRFWKPLNWFRFFDYTTVVRTVERSEPTVDKTVK